VPSAAWRNETLAAIVLPMDMVERIRRFCADRRWFGPDMLRDEGFQLGERRGQYQSSFLWAPATEQETVAAEEQLGFELPTTLRRLLRELANGDFGPGYGLKGIPAAAHENRPRITEVPPESLKLLELFENNREIEAAMARLPGINLPPLPTRESMLEALNAPPPSIVSDHGEGRYRHMADGPWLPLIDWGCGVHSVVHVPTTVVIRQHDYEGFWQEASSLDTWLGDWLDGVDLWERMEAGLVDGSIAMLEGCDWRKAL
jgi:hypothetical protein